MTESNGRTRPLSVRTDEPPAVLYVQRPGGGGSATGLYELVRALDRRRLVPHVLFHEPNRYVEEFRRLGVTVHVLNPPAHRLWPVAFRIARLIRDEGIALVHHNNNPGANRPSILAASLAGVSQVAHVRFLRSYGRMDRWLARRIDRFVYMSRAIEERTRAELHVAADRGVVLYDPFDLNRFANANGSRRAAVRAELGLAEGDQVVVNVGRLVPWKGQDVFLRAAAEVLRTRPRARALIVGGPGDEVESREFARRLRQDAAALGLEGRVVFTGFRADVPELLAASDLVVHSATRPEPFGRVVVEAMAAGRPVIATSAGGVLEILEDGRTGRLVPPGDAAALAAALAALLDAPERATEMGRQARQDAEVRFGAERFARSLERIYDRAMGAATPLYR